MMEEITGKIHNEYEVEHDPMTHSCGKEGHQHPGWH